jgi:L-iditol 2-dehydrogenase
VFAAARGGGNRLLAAQIIDQGRIACVSCATPEVHSGAEVLIQTLVTSICGSDVRTVFQAAAEPLRYPCPPGFSGHESVGLVIEPGGSNLKPGDLVLAVPGTGYTRAFAEYQAMPSSSLIALPPGANPFQMVLAQQLGTVIFALKHFWRGPGAGFATVIGAGPGGLLFAQVLRSMGFKRVLISDPVPARRSRALALGIDISVDSVENAAVVATLEATDGQGADLVVEAVGLEETFAQAIDAVKVDGIIGYFGVPHHGLIRFPLQRLFRKRAWLRGYYGAQWEPGLASFRAALGLISGGGVDVSDFVTHRLPISEVMQAFELARERRGDAFKIALTFRDSVDEA